MLVALVIVPIIGVIIRRKRVGIITAGINFIISIVMWLKIDNNETNFQMNKYGLIGVDGISVVFIVLTTFITIQIMNESKSEVMILIISSVLIMTFISLDIMIWYISFEAILIPMFIMIMKRSRYAAYKLFIYTIMGSIMMLIGIIIMDYTTRNDELYIFI